MCEFREIMPCNDVAFKIIFTQPNHERILIHFLNCAIKTDTPITKVKLLDREITPDQVNDKGSRLDILAETENGEKIDIEMQVNRDEGMVKRSLFYWARNYTSDFKQGQSYKELKRTVCINILNFNLFDDDQFWGIGKLYDIKREAVISEDLEIQFIELNKMNHIDASSPITFWIEFFKDPYSDASQEIYTLVPEILDAKSVFDRAIADDETRKKILQREDALRNFNSAIKDARDKERAQAEIEKAELKAQAEKEKSELKAKAEKEKSELKAKAEAEKMQSARKMLADGLPADLVAKYSGLMVEEVKSFIGEGK